MSLLRLAHNPLLRCSAPQLQFFRTFLTTTSLEAAAPVLPRLKSDLKDAMRAKDKPRLDVLRSIMAEITNASKTSKPIESDSQLLQLLRKQLQSSEKAVEEFQSAKRDDLVEKERGQIQILQSYADEIPVVSEQELRTILQEVAESLKSEGKVKDGAKPSFGMMMKNTMEKVAGRPVDMKSVTSLIGEVSQADGGGKKAKSAA